MKKDRLDLGAILQRDRQTYAIVPHMAGGICTPETLRKIADIAEKYSAKAIKATGAQRLAIVGLEEEDLPKVWEELGMKPAAAVGMCVRSIKFCPGTTFCRLGQQDSVSIGTKLDQLYHGYSLPNKFKIGVSGCPNSCADSWVRDIGLIGTKKGWKLVVGGNSGSNPRIAHEVATGLNDDEAIELVKKIIDYFSQSGKRFRLGKFINEIGIDRFKKELGLIAPEVVKEKIDTSKINKIALHKIGYGLYVIGSALDGKLNAQIANTVFQVTSEPPTIAVSINKNNLTHEYIKASSVFSVSILSQDTPLEFIGTFGFHCGREKNKFENCIYKIGKTGAPIVIENSLAFIEARVIEEVSVGTHTIFIGQVEASDIIKDGTPMTYSYYHEVKKGKSPKNAPTYIKEDKAPTSSSQKYQCKICGYIYDPQKGDPDNNIAPGTPFENLPDEWICPICGASKKDFEKI